MYFCRWERRENVYTLRKRRQLAGRDVNYENKEVEADLKMVRNRRSGLEIRV